MDNVLGLILFVVYLGAVIGIAAAITWLVVKISPRKADDAKPPGAG
ncbi:MAG: hypothetical protein ABR569_12165 [Gaiellaceae bacterium]